MSEITEALWQEYEEFATRDLSEFRPVHLFVDGLAERLHPVVKRGAILAAWAICGDGRKVLLDLSPGSKDSMENCKEFLSDPKIAATLPAEALDEVRAAVSAAYEAPTPAMAVELRQDAVARFPKVYPAVVQCADEDLAACIAHPKCPRGHRRAMRTTNLLERLFVGARRRVRAAVQLSGERAVPKLMYSALSRAAHGWRGIAITDFERRQLERVAEETRNAHQEETKPVTKPRSTPLPAYSRKRT